MTSHKSLTSQVPLDRHLFEIYNSLLETTNKDFSLSGKTTTPFKTLSPMKSIQLKMPRLVYLEKTKNGILLKQEEILKVLAVLTTGLLIIHCAVFNLLGFIQPGFLPCLVAASPLLLNVILLVLAYRNMHAASLFIISWLLPAAVVLVSFNDPTISYSRVLIIYALVIPFLNETKSRRLATFLWMAFAMIAVQIRYSSSQMGVVNSRFMLLDLVMLPLFCFIVYLVLSRVKKEFAVYQKGIRAKKELLEKKNESLEELVSLSEEQREKLKKTVLFKEKLISIISHDIRVPINSFKFLIENYERGYLTDKMVLDGIIETKKDLTKMDNMVLDLVNWSKGDKTDQEQQSVSYQQLHEIIESVLAIYSLCAKNKKLNIIPIVDIPEGMGLSVPKRELEIILRNLLSNAIKFSTQENKIIVALKTKPGNSTVAELSIRDFGTGMHPSVLERLNGNRVISTIGTMNEVGLGVGLSIVFDVINSQNLQYNIQSKTGKGTRFSVNIPLISCQS